MSKVTYLADLYKNSVEILTKNPSQWKALLATMSRFHKRSFDNAVLIHVQNPNATQLATFDEWHGENIGRSINKGAKGLAVIDMSNPQASFKYYFDLMDTNGTPESFKRVVGYMWELENQYKPEVLHRLQDKYGVESQDFESAIYELVANCIDEKYNEKFKADDLDVTQADLKPLLVDSCYYMVASRSGLDVNFVDDTNFGNLKHFGELEGFMEIGAMVMSVAKPILQEISSEINNVKAERSKIYDDQSLDKPNLQSRAGRTSVSQLGNFGEVENSGRRQISCDVEGLHDGKLSTDDVAADNKWSNHPENFGSGRENGRAEGNVDTTTSASSTIASDGGHIDASQPHEDDLPNSRRSFDRENPVGKDLIELDNNTNNELNNEENNELNNQLNNEITEPSVSSTSLLLTDGFFVIPESQSVQESFLSHQIAADDNLPQNLPKVSENADTSLKSGNLEDTCNYHYTSEHNLYEGGPKTKCKANIEAIKLLKELENTDKPATVEQQIVLASYLGWGGFANALTPDKAGRESEYAQLKALLTEEEFKSAAESTTTAYFTEHMVVEHIYQALERFGFKGGNILDPAMGTGNFFSVLPEKMATSNLFGVELDSITGRIGKKLYPTANIEIKGFEDTTYPDQFFDVAIGNIPFNSIQISDKRYDKHNFKIHDYFIAKSLDKVRPGGIIAFVTSKWVLDKSNQNVRKYIAQRAELVGAIRLPNTAFKQVAGTEVTTDILFFQKRERDIVPSLDNTAWLSVEENDNGVPMNSYFIDHPEMVLGEMVFDKSMFGNDKSTECHPMAGDDLAERLEQAIHYLDCNYFEATSEFEDEKESLRESVPASPIVKNFSYTLVDGEIFYRENSKMYRQDIAGKKAERIKGMVQIHSDIQGLVDYQSDDYIRETTSIYGYNENIKEMIETLNKDYDSFVKQFGYLNSAANVSAFRKDGAAPLLRSIEQQNSENKNIYEKSAIFYKATIHKKEVPKAVFNADDALMVCMNTKGRVDLKFMAHIYVKPNSETGKATPAEIIEELGNKIFKDPDMIDRNDDVVGYVLADEYLSGYVKDKLATVKFMAGIDSGYVRNVEALEKVQPIPLEAHEINFTLGSTWIPKSEYQNFVYELCETYRYNQGSNGIEVEFSEYTGAYYISNKSCEYGSVIVNSTYGTSRKNAYEIIEDTLNLKKVEVRDPVEYNDSNGEKKKKYVVNQKETILAREKQSIIEQKFKDWLFREPSRSDRMEQLYNDLMNNLVVREYNGQDLIFPDMSESIALRSHQKDVIAHGLYGDGNLLMAHEVGAGKTYSAIGLSYELKRIGAVQKPLITVPNHLVGQWATAYMELYPNANILVAEKRDFEKVNRRRFASRIAVGDYDAVIMAHSSFELIGLSREYQLKIMEAEIADVTHAIIDAKAMRGDKWSLKQMEIFKKNLQFRYEKLYNADKKDTVINFEQLGVDCLVVDESHAYKNNFSYTKLRNVAGIGSTSSQRAMDMHMKAQYINEINDGKGVIYLTGTPISNSMAELYVLQKTLQPKELAKRKQLMFDSWASAYGVITSSLEIKPEGNGYQMKNRFSQFHNLPELMKMFRMVADIKTSDMLDEVPVPKLKNNGFTVVKTAITPYQKDIVLELAERAENIRSGRVKSDVDNFLKLTMEARLLATDPRILNPLLPDDPDFKLNVCAKKVAEVYFDTADEKLTQIIFCDQGTPKDDGDFNFYDATKEELIRQGVEPQEIAYIHDANTDLQKEQLFEKVRTGEVRVLIGSTAKMGTGMNVQDKLIALHHLDIPWRPSDLIQRNGRIIRQGNENAEVEVFNYITEDTFDSYLWQILEQKQRYISQIMSGDSTIRKCEDLDETVLQYAEFKALAISDPRIKEKMEVDNELARLTILKSSYQSGLATMKKQVDKNFPEAIQRTNRRIEQITKDIATLEQNKPAEFAMVIDGRTYSERTKAAEHFKVLLNKLQHHLGATLAIGTYAGLNISLYRDFAGVKMMLQGAKQYDVEIGDSELGAITRMENAVEKIPPLLSSTMEDLENLEKQLAAARVEVAKPFPNEQRLEELQVKKVQLDLALEFAQSGETGGIEQELYEKLYPMMKPILEDDAYYIKYKSEGFEDLVIEKIGEKQYSIAHYYEQNFDLMRDPEVTFYIENEGIKPLSYLQDNMGIFYDTSSVEPAIVADLKNFMSEWFDNLKHQDYEVYEKYGYDNDDVEVEAEIEEFEDVER